MSFGRKIDDKQVNISVIIAIKNEAQNIDGLLSSLKNLDYPADFYEVIIVDDNSSDGTSEKLKLRINKFNNLSLEELKRTGLTGKRNALEYGISIAKYSNIVITDADCRPEPGWLKSHSKSFDEGFNFQFGIAPFEQNSTFINKITCFENLRSSILTFSFAGLGLPYSAAARNLGFTKKAFLEIDGYLRTQDTLSGDDDLLLREAIKQKLKIVTITENGSFVYSRAKETFKDYLNQRARHTQTSFYYLLKQKLALGLWHLLNLFFLFSVVLIAINPLWGILALFKLITDTIVVKFYEKNFGYRFNLLEIIPLQIMYELLLILHFVNARFMKIKWK
jgi:cellulose synthase/poly-beta-1,6-N-acetylglucosamine synthase-like glycosyltransferase